MKHYFLRNKFVKVWQYADAMASRWIGGEVSEEIKDIRNISCHGSMELNIPPCEFRVDSINYPKSHYCGACNCGDFQTTQLTNLDKDHYSKLDYPRVTCPKEMPGFTNFVPLNIPNRFERKGLIEEIFGVQYLSELNTNKETEK